MKRKSVVFKKVSNVFITIYFFHIFTPINSKEIHKRKVNKQTKKKNERKSKTNKQNKTQEENKNYICTFPSNTLL